MRYAPEMGRPLIPVLLVIDGRDLPPWNKTAKQLHNSWCRSPPAPHPGLPPSLRGACQVITPAQGHDARPQQRFPYAPKISSNSMPLSPKTLMNQGRLPLEYRPVPTSAPPTPTATVSCQELDSGCAAPDPTRNKPLRGRWSGESQRTGLHSTQHLPDQQCWTALTTPDVIHSQKLPQEAAAATSQRLVTRHTSGGSPAEGIRIQKLHRGLVLLCSSSQARLRCGPWTKIHCRHVVAAEDHEFACRYVCSQLLRVCTMLCNPRRSG